MINRFLNKITNLTTLIRYNSQRLKGPTSQRKKKPDHQEEDAITMDDIQNQRLRRLAELRNLYQYGYTAEEMEGSSQQVKRVFKVENCRPAEILKFKISRAVKKFQKSPTDFGSAAVQTSVMSQKIIYMMEHMQKHTRDKATGIALRRLIQKRRDMLHYLMRTDYHYYKWVCMEYGLPEVFPLHAHHRKNFFNKPNSLQGI